MPLKYVAVIPKIRKVSRYDAVIEEAVKMIDKDPTKLVEISEEGPGLPARFAALQKEAGMYASVSMLKRQGKVYLTHID